MEAVRLDPVEQVLNAGTGQTPHLDEGGTAAVAGREFQKTLADAKGRVDLVARQQSLRIQDLSAGLSVGLLGREVREIGHGSLA